jgi:hypothetical protein
MESIGCPVDKCEESESKGHVVVIDTARWQEKFTTFLKQCPVAYMGSADLRETPPMLKKLTNTNVQHSLTLLIAL